MEALLSAGAKFALSDVVLRATGDGYQAWTDSNTENRSPGTKIVLLCPKRVRELGALTGPSESTAKITSFFTHVIDIAGAGTYYLAAVPGAHPAFLVGALHNGAGRLLDDVADRPIDARAPQITENRVILVAGMSVGGAVTWVTSGVLPFTVSTMLGVTAAKVTTAALCQLRLFVCK